jgi:hypothetical protein
MRLIPSRYWVKESIPAFLCCETSPWASLWIRFFVWLCPECKQEYQSMRQVWEDLDCWEEDIPPDTMEDQFSQTIRSKFPSAFEHEKEPALPRTGDFILRLAYSASILLLGGAVFLAQERHPTTALQPVANAGYSSAVLTAPQNLPIDQLTTNPLLANAGILPRNHPKHTTNLPSKDIAEVAQPEDYYPARGVQILTTSMGNSGRGQSLRPGYTGQKRTVQINHLPVSGFDTLLAAEDDRSY